MTGTIHLLIDDWSETKVPGRTMRCLYSSHSSAYLLTLIELKDAVGPSTAMRCCAWISRARISASVRTLKVIRRRFPVADHPTSIAATHWPREFR